MRLSPRAYLGQLPFRARLAATIFALFLLTGVALLAFVVLLARHGTAQQVQGLAVRYADTPDSYVDLHPAARPVERGPTAPGPRWDTAEIQKIDQTIQAVQDTALRQMVLWSAIGLLFLALLAGLVGWWLAGRALRPVASMTETARRISEQNLHQRLALSGPDDELHRLADTFDAVLDRLEKSFDSQRRFVANASHELKTPLAAQRAALQVGLADPLPDHLTEVRDDLLATNREAEQLIDALLLLARSDRGPAVAESVDLALAAQLVTAQLAPQAEQRQVDVHVSADTPLTVRGDPVLLRHLLTNVIRNAVQYNHPSGHVRVHVEACTVTVANTGPHVPAHRVPDLFEPFRRLAPDRTADTGHGLGLSIAASIASSHHATLTAEPRPTGGLTVRLAFS
ncbi:signal transduction histidine kinase [Streptomyces sp. SAI-135]|uniref:sensor histidine kinase n=1 Tax=unclassified Streptomyces TaxID=2593676 RepID=UPI0024730B5B|nr:MULTISPECIES: HAMP domain-containing sensor histidine kinase [unclassified Streptomyces]MDH6514207.1 signal transduction histidine kinase [Streptomyces sp. SAI-090]MDH6621713.1 signal transduction histidine kinase [Streptomyces sp. SAI-135]